VLLKKRHQERLLWAKKAIDIIILFLILFMMTEQECLALSMSLEKSSA